MKQKLFFTGIILLFLFSCKNQGNRNIQSNVIDIEHGVQNLTRFKVSDFGKTIRYIPLETTDNGLVGNSPTVKVLRDYIVIEFATPKSCLLFNKQDGSFIAEIGHLGQGPNEYTNNFSWTDEKEDFLYFGRSPNQLVKYDMKGNFCGKTEFSISGLASNYMLTDSEIIGYFDGINSSMRCPLGFFDKEGILKDTIPFPSPNLQIIPAEITGIDVFGRNPSYKIYGNWARTGIIIIGLKNDAKRIISQYATKLWRNNENIRFKEEFVDTIYTVSDSKLIPSIAFNTGKYHWPIEEATNISNTDERIFIADVSENNDFIFFQCIRGLFSNDGILYNGLYDKKTGETKLSKNSDGIEDDLTRFMPFTPLGMSTSGEFVSLIEAGDAMEWLERHPEALNNEKLSFLKELDEEKNPIVILVE